MSDLLLFASIVAGWIVLNVWILPMFGIHTCMSGACQMPHPRKAEARNPAEEVTSEHP